MCQPNGKGWGVSAQNFPGEITFYANQECVQGLAKQGYQKMRGIIIFFFFGKNLKLKYKAQCPFRRKQNLVGLPSIYIFCSEASILFWITYRRHGIIIFSFRATKTPQGLSWSQRWARVLWPPISSPSGTLPSSFFPSRAQPASSHLPQRTFP